SYPASSPCPTAFVVQRAGGLFLAPVARGHPFALALATAFAWLLAFQPRQLLIIPSVLVGWVCALVVCTLLGGHLWWGGPFVAGGIGALITTLGIPLATRRRLARRSYLAITLTGALVAGVWGILSDAHAYYWYELFVPWQAFVAMAIGRSIGTSCERPVQPAFDGVPP
ncbi:MAG: hypothetical protein J2P54_19140, partial [Bradyrhizobiaceae bacterium]|nr:hypothetical protein [Bradyrhizobiaceae bacterium]